MKLSDKIIDKKRNVRGYNKNKVLKEKKQPSDKTCLMNLLKRKNHFNKKSINS